MPKLTPTAQAALGALNEGPANVHELREKINRSRSATDKAIGELAGAALITKVPGGDPADGAPTRWELAPGDAAAADPGADSAVDDGAADSGAALGGAEDDGVSEPDSTMADGSEQPADPPAAHDEIEHEAANGDWADGPGTSGHETPGADTDTAVPPAEPESAAEPTESGAEPGTDTVHPNPVEPGAAAQQPDGAEGRDDAESAPAPEQPKICRGCQAQMPKTCPSCWQKAPAYCGTCRKDMPATRRGEPGDPQILSNGLTKLRPGELEQLVLKVLKDQPLPHHVGVTGWTGGRVAIYLPGRSTGAINNALEKLARTGQVELIGDAPMRFKLKTEEAHSDEDTTDSATEPPADPQPVADDSTASAVIAEPHNGEDTPN